MNPPAIRLNLGCGGDWKGDHVINIDCRNLIPPGGETFLRADISDLADMFQDGAAAEIWAKDVIEHFPQGRANAVLDEWVRLLAPGGLLHIRTLDLVAAAEFILHGNAHYGPAPSDDVKAYRIYGGQDYPENFHKAGFTRASLTEMLMARGLEIVAVRPTLEGTVLPGEQHFFNDSTFEVTARKPARPGRFDLVKRIENLDDALTPYYSPKDRVLTKEGQKHPAHSRNYYEWYYSYAQALRPTTVLEIGVLYGYSSIAMIMGHPDIQRLYLFDMGAYGTPLTEGVENIKRLFTGEIIPHAVNTQALTRLDVPEPIDLIHVDGDHTPKGLAHDLDLVLPCLAPTGMIVVDDIIPCAGLRDVCMRFAEAHGLVSQFLPTFRGHLLLSRPEA